MTIPNTPVSYTVTNLNNDTNKDGLLVRSQMDTTNPKNVVRKMSDGEEFLVYQTYVVKRNQVWGRLTNNPGAVQQEYCCLSIANRTFAVPDNFQPHGDVKISLQWIQQVDVWARSQAKPFTGIPPF